MSKIVTFVCLIILNFKIFGSEEFPHVFGIILTPEKLHARFVLNQNAYPLSCVKPECSTIDGCTTFKLRMEIEDPSIVANDEQEEFDDCCSDDLQYVKDYLDSHLGKLPIQNRPLEHLFAVSLTPERTFIRHDDISRDADICTYSIETLSENGKRIFTLYIKIEDSSIKEDEQTRVWQTAPYTSDKVTERVLLGE